MKAKTSSLGAQATGSDMFSPGGPRLDLTSRSNERWLKLLWILLLVVVLSGVGVSAYTETRVAKEHARRVVADRALMLKQHASRYIEGADLIIRHVASVVERAGWNGVAGATAPNSLVLDDITGAVGWVENLWLIDAAGRVRLALDPRSASNAMAVMVAGTAGVAMAAPHGLHFGEPVTERGVDWAPFIISRAIRDRKGDVIGAVVVAITGESLADVFSQQVLGQRGTVALLRGDGAILARYPSTSGSLGGDPRDRALRDVLLSGANGDTLITDVLLDGQEWIVAVARMEGMPLAAMASHSMADLRAGLISSLWPQYLLAGLIVLGLLGLYPFIIRRLRFERQAARDVAERELLFRSILNNVGVGLALVAADGTLRFANTGFDRLLGYKPGSLIGRNLEELTHPDDRFATMYRVSRMEALGPSGLSFEKRYVRQDGSVVEALVTVSLKPRVGEQEPLLVGVIQDLTELRAREKAIAFQNSLLRIQQEASPDALLVTDADGRVRSWNSRFQALWQVPKALLETGDVMPVLRHIAKHVAPDTPETFGEADQAGWLRRKLTDGRVIDTLESELRDSAGAVIGHVWFFRDVSARLAAEAAVRESEARYRALVEQSPEAIVVYCDDRVLFANSAALALFGYENSNDWPDDAAVSSMVAPGMRDHVCGAIQSNTSTSWNGIQEDLQRRDGSLFDAWVISAPIRVNDQPAVQAVIRPLDTGQGVRGRLMQTAKMATLGQMAASVAHELSQPLNILSMGLEGLRLRLSQGDLTPHALDQALEQATRQCGRMAEIIDHIRVFSRSSKRRREPFDAAGPLRGAVEMMRPVFDREGITLTAAIPAQVGVVEGSALDLEQVVINLLKNAFDALQEQRQAGDGALQQSVVTVTVHPDAGRRQLVIEVADSGPGIPENLLEDIFEPFFTTKKEGVGTGLGLSICMTTVTKMGGALRADNRDGAVFTLRLPLSDSLPVDAGGGDGPIVIADEPIPNGGPTGHVLLVEADAPTRQGLAALLVEHGYRVTTAGTGAEAEDKARRDPPCVLLAALELPDGPDGPTLLDQLRARDPELRAVFMARGGAVPQGEPPQGAVVLTRPVEATRLFSALQAALSSKTEQETAAP